MSRLVRAHVAIPQAARQGLLSGVHAHTQQKLTEHEPGKAAPDYDHPLVRTLIERMPHQTYAALEAVKRHLEAHGLQNTQTSPRVVDGMLRLVNEELQRRDRLREMDAVSMIDLLTKGAP